MFISVNCGAITLTFGHSFNAVGLHNKVGSDFKVAYSLVNISLLSLRIKSKNFMCDTANITSVHKSLNLLQN